MRKWLLLAAIAVGSLAACLGPMWREPERNPIGYKIRVMFRDIPERESLSQFQKSVADQLKWYRDNGYIIIKPVKWGWRKAAAGKNYINKAWIYYKEKGVPSGLV